MARSCLVLAVVIIMDSVPALRHDRASVSEWLLTRVRVAIRRCWCGVRGRISLLAWSRDIGRSDWATGNRLVSDSERIVLRSGGAVRLERLTSNLNVWSGSPMSSCRICQVSRVQQRGGSGCSGVEDSPKVLCCTHSIETTSRLAFVHHGSMRGMCREHLASQD
jgi:hypothetical protein